MSYQTYKARGLCTVCGKPAKRVTVTGGHEKILSRCDPCMGRPTKSLAMRVDRLELHLQLPPIGDLGVFEGGTGI